MIRIGRGAFIASLFFFGSAFADQVLVGLAWHTPQQLQKIEARVESVRYVARGIAFVQGDLRVLGDFRVLCHDRAEVGDDYYSADHIHWPLPEDVDLIIVEPLREFYKDEVRQIARKLQIPSSERQPFPGPGLAVRVLGEITPERIESCREACHIVETRIKEAASRGMCDLPWQYFAALLPVRSVGVHGDTRVHGETIVVRAVTSLDGMSAKYSPLPQDLLAEISTEITNSLKGQVNRVVYDITHKPPGTIEWE